MGLLLITAVVGPAKLAASCRGALSRGSLQPQPRHTMQIALPGSLHRVIVWLCTSVHSLTVEAHRVAVHSLTAIHHSRGTRCRSPCRARCIVSSCRCVLSHSNAEQSTTAEAHDADRPAGLAASCHRVAVQQRALSHNTIAEAHDADRPAGLAASCHRVAV
jgi:hypothetical protein